MTYFEPNLFPSLALTDGSIMVMYGDFQSLFTHEIKKEPNVTGERISLTFRVVKTNA